MMTGLQGSSFKNTTDVSSMLGDETRFLVSQSCCNADSMPPALHFQADGEHIACAWCTVACCAQLFRKFGAAGDATSSCLAMWS